jgi:hypothetical protein
MSRDAVFDDVAGHGTAGTFGEEADDARAVVFDFHKYWRDDV